jgi:hypothetical protein
MRTKEKRTMSEKAAWIREQCSDFFEGIPCQYPDCNCSPENKARFEKEFDEQGERDE